MTKYIQCSPKEYGMINQMFRSGTAIGALVSEAAYAQSTADFINKLSIALKECNETLYWLNILKDTEYINEKEFISMSTDCEELLALLISSIKTTKNNNEIMDEQLKQIGERLRGLREVLDIPVSEMAETIGISSEKYEKIESGEMDITISNLMKIAKKYGISTEELIFAESAHMKSYFVVRKGQGMSVERTKAYKYQSLVSGFVDHKADVFIVTVEPKPGARTIYKNTHPGQEFNLILEGSMELYIGGKTIVLEEGDSIYFDSTKPHGMLAIGNKAVKFLAFTVE